MLDLRLLFNFARQNLFQTDDARSWYLRWAGWVVVVPPDFWLFLCILTILATFSRLVLFALLLQHNFLWLLSLIPRAYTCQRSQTWTWSFGSDGQVLNSGLVCPTFVLRCWTDSLVRGSCVGSARSCFLFFMWRRATLLLFKFDLLDFNDGLALLLRRLPVNLIH